MKIKLLALLICSPLMSFSLISQQNSPILHEINDVFNVEVIDSSNPNEYRITSLNNLDLNEYRIYSEYENDVVIKEINSNLFDSIGQSFEVMVSSYLDCLDPALFSNSNLNKISFTGSSEEWNLLNIQTTKTVTFYQKDEGFINYWNTNIRPTAETDICSITKDTYQELKAMYQALSAYDLANVNNYTDKSGNKINKTMSFLASYFNPAPEQQERGSELSKDTTLGLIVSIAIFGMTTISIFYLLKRKNIIK